MSGRLLLGAGRSLRLLAARQGDPMKHYPWAVIGAGPAGVITRAMLPNYVATQPAEIAWVDPHFKVGDLGLRWSHVSSNTKVATFNVSFQRLLSELQSQHRLPIPPAFKIDSVSPEETCVLSFAAERLQWLTDQLLLRSFALQSSVTNLVRRNSQWDVHLANQHRFTADNVVLATGSEPKSLNLPIEEISLVDACHPKKLSLALNKIKTVAVFGSSHSAMLIVKELLSRGVAVINFYHSSPALKYAVYHEGWIENDNTGLKGDTAKWAREVICADKPLPSNLVRVANTPANLALFLPQCQKAIYAIGFQQRKMAIAGFSQKLHYDDSTGVIAPGLYGVGIGFPRLFKDRVGNLEHRVGILKFVEDIAEMMSAWCNYKITKEIYSFSS